MASARSITSTVTPLEIDSREYIFAYSIRSRDDLPGDFPVPPAERNFRIGMFLPRDPPDWFERSAYPPRVVLLSHDSITVLAHPKSSEAPVRIPLTDLTYYETGHFLLIGWLRMVAGASEITLPYNTRSSNPVAAFLRELGRVYLREQEVIEASDAQSIIFGSPLDIKFTNALKTVLDIGEHIQARIFNPPVERWRKPWLFRVRVYDPGDLIALTGRRIVWVTDRLNQRYDRYGTITRTAPASTVAGAQCERTGKNVHLTIRFRWDAKWVIPLRSECYEEAQRFAEYIYA